MTFAERLTASVEGILGGFAERIPYLAIGLAIVLIGWWVSRLVHRIVRAVMARTSTEGHVDLIVAKSAGAATFLVGLLVALGVMGVQVAALVTSLGLVGLSLGFALRDVLANSMAGVLLLLQRPFTVGDSITVAGIQGTVRDIRVRDTLLEAPDGRRVFVPNSTVFSQPITNASAVRMRRLEVRVPVAVTADLGLAMAVVKSALAGVSGVCDDPAPAAEYGSVRVATAVLIAHAWVDTAETGFGSVQNAATLAVTSALRQEGLLRA
jgi:small conductance mechanosensitive channel